MRSWVSKFIDERKQTLPRAKPSADLDSTITRPSYWGAAVKFLVGLSNLFFVCLHSGGSHVGEFSALFNVSYVGFACCWVSMHSEVRFLFLSLFLLVLLV